MTLHLTAWVAALFLSVSMFGSGVALRLLLLFTGTALAIAAVVRNRELQRLPPIWIPFAAWAAWAALSLLWSIEPERSLKELRNEMFYAGLALWMCFIGAQARQAARVFFPVLSVAAVLVCAIALQSFLAGGERYLTGLHGGPGAHSSALLTLLPLVLMTGWYISADSDRRWLLWGTWGIVCLFFASAFTTLNRTVWLGFATQLTILGGMLAVRDRSLGKRARWIALSIALASIAGALVMMVAVQVEREAIGGRAFSTDTRLALWPRIAEHIMERPLTGYGFGRGLLRESLGQVLRTMDQHLWHAHNFFLETLVQLGAPGLILVLWLLGTTVLAGWRAARSSDRHAAACGMALVAVVAGMLVRNMTDTLFVRQSALLYWGIVAVLLAGIAARMPREAVHRSAETAPARLS